MTDAGRGGAPGGGRPDKPSLEDLDARLRKARKAQAPKGAGPVLKVEGAGSLGLAWRMVVELFVAFGVCGLIGWALDGWLGTRPWFFIGFLVLGAGAGVMNVYRAAKQIGEAAERGREAPGGTTGAGDGAGG